MAEAVQELFPGTQVTIGPVIENGFYYDFYRPGRPVHDGRPAEDRGQDARDYRARRPLHQGGLDPRPGKDWFATKGEAFKIELVDAIPAGRT